MKLEKEATRKKNKFREYLFNMLEAPQRSARKSEPEGEICVKIYRRHGLRDCGGRLSKSKIHRAAVEEKIMGELRPTEMSQSCRPR